jgi:superfamily II DNA or RNA helicase
MTRAQSKKAESMTAVRPKPLGWNTTDEDEIVLRRWRGATEPMSVRPLESQYRYFGAFCVQSTPQQSYHVEIRHLSALLNACDCPDFQHNGLGVCKHIEKTLWYLRRRGNRKFAQAESTGSPRVEIYLDRREQHNNICIQWPTALSGRLAVKRLIDPFFSTDGRLLTDPVTGWSALRSVLEKMKPKVRALIRISSHVEPFIQQCRHHQQKQQYQQTFLRDIQQGKRTLDIVKLPLYPYQQEGVLHLALNERALLCDDMGLGKTSQAIAACELLRRTQGIKKVLVVATASLKTEWEEQIKKFVDLPYLIISGERAQRLKQYRQPGFFYLTNYEQIISDAADIQGLIAPDIIILDEAQRIKNWQTKTAHAIKQLHSRYAFVLTGTPLENRIDDVYSIVQFLDPSLFGPLFRFNRQFYELNDKGKPVAYKNLDQLHRRLQTILLRRRKQDIEQELPPCMSREFFVGMTEEQTTRYQEQEKQVSRLAKLAERRPLSPEEFKKLQRHLSCMRMLCDTPYILDPDCRDCPKLIELEKMLEELLADSTTKIIIFSEWSRMLQLVRELAQGMGFGAAWHTGDVTQRKRREEINRFKQDPHCRLFLSTDSGSVGLNLQAANVVINLDLPWNPAKLAQRIARAWRKHQERRVQVINLITQHSIEHRMVHLLSQKQTLSQGVLHGDNDLRSMKLPSGRHAFLEQIAELLQPVHPQSPASSTTQSWDQLPKAVHYLAVRERESASPMVLAVTEHPSMDLREQTQMVVNAHYPQQTPVLEMLDRQMFAAIQRLAQMGLLTLHPQMHSLYGDAETAASAPAVIPEHWLTTAWQKQQQAEHPLRLARLLLAGEFYREALPPWREAVELLLAAVAWRQGLGETLQNGTLSREQIQAVINRGQLPESALSLTVFLQETPLDLTRDVCQRIWRDTESLLKLIIDSPSKK